MEQSLHRIICNRECGLVPERNLFATAYNSRDVAQRLILEKKLSVHRGCVNSICWNEAGDRILSGSDDQNLVISDPFSNNKNITITSGHRANIFSARYIPFSSDRKVVSCSGDGKIYYTDVCRDDMYGTNLFDCHVSTAYEIVVVPNEASTFFSCGEDGTVRWFDLRIRSSCTKENCKDYILINCKRAVTAMSVNPMVPYQLALAGADGNVKIYDRRMLGTRAADNYNAKAGSSLLCLFSAPVRSTGHRITSLVHSSNGEDLLVSYSSEQLYLFNMKGGELEAKKLHKTPEILKEQADIEDVQSPSPSLLEPTASAINRQPPIKRLRLRGDWSDTGPNARPEGERPPDELGHRSPHATIMQRMSDMLTRWLDGTLRNSTEGSAEGGTEQAEPSNEPSNEQAQAQAPEDSPPEQSSQRSADGNGAKSASQADNIPNNDEQSEPCSSTATSSISDALHDNDSSAETPSTSKPNVPDVAKSDERKRNVATTDFWKADHDKIIQESLDILKRKSQPDVRGDAISDSDSSSEEVGARARPSLPKSHEPSPPQQVEGRTSDQSSHPPRQVEGRTSDQSSQTHSTYHMEPVISLQYDSQGTSNSSVKLQMSSIPCRGISQSPPPTEQNVPSSVTSQSNISARYSDDTHVKFSESLATEITRKAFTESCFSSNDNLAQTESTMDDSIKRQAESGITTCDESLGRTTESVSSPLVHVSSLEEQESSVAEEKSSSVLINITSGDDIPTTCDMEIDTSENEKEASNSDTQELIQLSDASGSGQSCSQDAGQMDEQEKRKSKCSTPIIVTTDFSSDISNQSVSDVTSNPVISVSHCDSGNTPSGMDVDNNETAGSERAVDSREISPSPTLSDIEVSHQERIPAASNRRRKIGMSGPPTGDFNLDLTETTSTDEETDDTDSLNRDTEYLSYRQSWPRRNTAAYERSKFKPRVRTKFSGHRNARTMIKEANFWGDQHVMSGSDCGHVFIWDRYTGDLQMLLEADRHVVNCLQPHPYCPILATSGIDYDVKIWTPSSSGSAFQAQEASELINRNNVMLEETRDTITVPAAFMLRVLASLNQIRSGRQSSNQESSSGSSSETEES